jgi:hypothetical protein
VAEAIEGLQPMLSALRKANAELFKDLRTGLREDVGKPFISDVQDRIRAIGLIRTGRLLRSLKLSITTSGIAVRSAPPLNPSPKAKLGYAGIYELRKDKPRPFINPTLDEWSSTGKTEQRLGGVLDRFSENFES